MRTARKCWAGRRRDRKTGAEVVRLRAVSACRATINSPFERARLATGELSAFRANRINGRAVFAAQSRASRVRIGQR